MFEIQHRNMSVLLNATKSSASSTNGVKIDCAKECPCGVPTIPVPDQFLEVMVTGGFKVWHIMFIIIAFVVTMVVVYCCFHRCRIPRTKQEIEADLMRTNLTTKFRDYLQEFPNEPTTFVEALKKVQELEEKAIENDEPGVRKRMGWLKSKGKDKVDKDVEQPKNDSALVDCDRSDGAKQTVEEKNTKISNRTDKQSMFAAKLKEQAKLRTDSLAQDDLGLEKPKQSKESMSIDKTVSKVMDDLNKPESELASSKTLPKKEKNSKTNKKKSETKNIELSAKEQDHESNSKHQSQSTKKESDKNTDEAKPDESKHQPAIADATAIKNPTSTTRAARTRRKRGDKPGLARTKVTHRGESSELTTANQLEIPATSHKTIKHHHRLQSGGSNMEAKSKTGTKMNAPPKSTLIQIPPDVQK